MADVTLFGMNFNAASEGLYDGYVPLGGLLIALFVGWFMKRELSFSELATGEQSSQSGTSCFALWSYPPLPLF